MLTQTGRPRTVIVPGWVYRALLRNKVNLNEVTNYAKMRQILSQDDMVSWAYLNNQYQLRKHHLTVDTLQSLFDGLTEQQLQEYKQTIQPLSLMDTIASSTLERLNDINNMTNTDPYQFFNVGDLVLVVLNESFESKVQQLEDLLNFIKQYMKAHYAISAIADASQLPLYTLYIELL